MIKRQFPRDVQYQLWGWATFIASALFFTAGSVRNGDWLSLWGSLLFLAACFVFVLPLILTSQNKSS